MNCRSVACLLTIVLLPSSFACQGDTLLPEPETEPDAGPIEREAAAPDATQPATRDLRAEAAAIVADPAVCREDADCCVVMDSCRSNGLVVGKEDFETVRSLIDMAPADRCHACIPAPVEVGCVDGRCVGYRVPTREAGVPAGLLAHHCGNLGVIEGRDAGAAAVGRCAQ